MPYPAVEVCSSVDGPLLGMRLAVKDVFDVAGFPTSAGSAQLLAASGVRATSAQIVQILLDGGARFVGKTVTDELAYSLIGDNIHFGMPVNPARPASISGGSSSGSAVAIAAGDADIAIGTDTSGSIRLPAAVNAVYGLRPTWGILSNDGCRPLAPSFDTVGIFASSLGALAKVAEVVGLPSEQTHREIFMVPREILDICDPVILDDFFAALAAAKLRYEVVEALSESSIDKAAEVFKTILLREAWTTNAELYERAPNSLAPGIRERLESGAAIDSRQYAEAKHARARISESLDRLLSAGFLIFPTLPITIPERGAGSGVYDAFRASCIRSLCWAGLGGTPQLAIPLSNQGDVPRSVSLLGRRGSDRALLLAALEFQTADA